MVTDCGLAVVTQSMDSVQGAPDEHGDSARWIAPEILANRGTFSKEADVFSFAMVMIEVRCIFTRRMENLIDPNKGFHWRRSVR